MKHRESIFKENIDISRVLRRGSVPIRTKLVEKFKANEKKIYLFFGLCAILNLEPFTYCINHFLSIIRCLE